jgi:uncharacterized membrane protein (UPF0127 family)
MMSPINLKIADSFLKRLKGLLGVNKIASDFALLLPRCKMVHTWAMQVPIGIFFIGSTGQILKCVPSLKPWRMAYHPQAVAVVETKDFDKKDIRKCCDAVERAYWLLNKSL